MQVKKQQLEPDMGQETVSKLGKEYAENAMRNARLDEAQAGIKIAWRKISNFTYADDSTLMAESKEELKSFLMKVKSLSRVRLFVTPWNVAYQAPLSMGFSSQ